MNYKEIKHGLCVKRDTLAGVQSHWSVKSHKLIYARILGVFCFQPIYCEYLGICGK